jgi:hypothetical protein
MKRRIFIGAIATLLIAFNVSSAGSKADFSGKWMMDAAKSKGVAAGMDQIMTISQTGDQLKVQTKIYPENTPNIVQNDDYTLDGKETTFTRQTPNGEAQVKRTSQWIADGKGFEIIDEVVNPTPKGPVTVKINRKWTMADDGKSLTIDLNQVDPQRTVQTSRLFVKQ